jgi:hypothetical protein
VKQAPKYQVNWFGISSVLCTLSFWIYAHAQPVPLHSIYIDVASIGIMTCAIPAALIAAWRGSRWWLAALLGPLVGWMFLLSLRT